MVRVNVVSEPLGFDYLLYHLYTFNTFLQISWVTEVIVGEYRIIVDVSGVKL